MKPTTSNGLRPTVLGVPLTRPKATKAEVVEVPDVKSLLSLSPPRDFDPFEGHATIRKGASIIPTRTKQSTREKYKRMEKNPHGSKLENDFSNNRPQLDHRAAVVEAARCLRSVESFQIVSVFFYTEAYLNLTSAELLKIEYIQK
jgi:hypothetical protein